MSNSIQNQDKPLFNAGKLYDFACIEPKGGSFLNLYHLKRTDNAERIRISTPLKLDSVEGCRFVLVGDADPNPGDDLFIANFGYESWTPGKVFRRNSTQFLLRYVLDGEGTR